MKLNLSLLAVTLMTPLLSFAISPDSSLGVRMKSAWEPENSAKEITIYTNSSLGTKMKGGEASSSSANSGLGFRMKGQEAEATSPSSSLGTRMKNIWEPQASVKEVSIYTNGSLGTKMNNR